MTQWLFLLPIAVGCISSPEGPVQIQSIENKNEFGAVCTRFKVTGLREGKDLVNKVFEDWNGEYRFLKFDKEGFPIYKFEGDEQYMYVSSANGFNYWHFNYVPNEPVAWMYARYTKNCPVVERSQWYYWDNAWSIASTVSFDLL